MKRRILICISVIVLVYTGIAKSNVIAEENVTIDTKEKETTVYNLNNLDDDSVNQMIQNLMEKSGFPGVSVAVTNGVETKYYTYGYSDISDEKLVTENTLFQLGSLTESFTATAVMLLVNEGKISLDDDVSKYIPWFMMKHNGTVQKITIRNLLYHMSGITSLTSFNIPEGIGDTMLEKTVRMVADTGLDNIPGQVKRILSVDYDVLALTIKYVTGENYDEYISKNILQTLSMSNTFFDTDKANTTGNMASGYKREFGHMIKYISPRYDGDIAANYMITSATDIGKWLGAQLLNSDNEELNNAIKNTHEIGEFTRERICDIDQYTKTNSNERNYYYYANGWGITEDGMLLTYNGYTPCYSSVNKILYNNNVAISVLCNTNGLAADRILKNITNMVSNRGSILNYQKGTNIQLDDRMSITAAAILALLTLSIMRLIYIIVRHKSKPSMSIFLKTLVCVFLVAFLCAWPTLMGYSFKLIYIWYSPAILVANFSAVLTISIYYVSILIKKYRKVNLVAKKYEKSSTKIYKRKI